MTTTIIETTTLAGCRCDGHERMRGVATVARQRLGLLSPDELFARWAAGVPKDEIDAMRRSLHARKLREQLKAG